MNSADVYVAANGKKIFRGDLEDPDVPGQVRVSLWPLDPSHWLAAGHFDLKTHRGNSTKLIEPSPNPESLKVIGQEAPEEFHKNLEEAESCVEKTQALLVAADEDYKSAYNDREKFKREWSGIKLTEARWLEYRALNLAVDRADAESKKIRDLLSEEIAKRVNSAVALDGWAFEELLRRREEEAAQKAAAAKPAEPTLSERWAKFTQRLTG